MRCISHRFREIKQLEFVGIAGRLKVMNENHHYIYENPKI